FVTCATRTSIFTLSLHDALPICYREGFTRHQLDAAPDHRLQRLDACTLGDLDIVLQEDGHADRGNQWCQAEGSAQRPIGDALDRSEEHTSELQSRENLVCRLLLE